eukprot:888128-Pleurochrysis_carterae.AAC.1
MCPKDRGYWSRKASAVLNRGVRRGIAHSCRLCVAAHTTSGECDVFPRRGERCARGKKAPCRTIAH